MNKRQWSLLGSAGLGVGLGAGLMFLLDPQAGGRRRALARDKVLHLLKQGGEAARKTSRDLGNRARGVVAETGSKLRQADVDDDILHDRVRSKIGHVVSHPHAIEVTVKEGLAILSGPVLASEVSRLLSTVRKVKGVTDVESHLEIHEHAENVPALQSDGRNGRRRAARNKIGAALGTISLGLLAQSLIQRRRGPYLSR
jgi:hypothetical protein